MGSSSTTNTRPMLERSALPRVVPPFARPEAPADACSALSPPRATLAAARPAPDEDGDLALVDAGGRPGRFRTLDCPAVAEGGCPTLGAGRPSERAVATRRPPTRRPLRWTLRPLPTARLAEAARTEVAAWLPLQAQECSAVLQQPGGLGATSPLTALLRCPQAGRWRAPGVGSALPALALSPPPTRSALSAPGPACWRVW